MLGNNGTHSWSQSLYKNPPYDTLRDFTPLGLAVESPRVIIVPKDLPANTLPEFIAYVKANQDKIQFASAGAGSASHVSCILLNAMLGVNVTHVPYRGLGPAMQDLIAGRVQYICDSVSTSKPQIEGGHVKAIATTGLKRSPALPNIPTAKEQGLDFDVLTWQGLFLAKDTPGADRQAAQRRVQQGARPAVAARPLRADRRGNPRARAPDAGIFRQVRRRRDRALERPDQGQRRDGGVTPAIVAAGMSPAPRSSPSTTSPKATAAARAGARSRLA